MDEQQANYQSVASLPDFRVFTWMFVIPGVLLVGLALFGLFGGRSQVVGEPTAVAFHPEDVEHRERQIV